MPEPLVAGLGDAAIGAFIFVVGGAILVRWKYQASQPMLIWGVGFACMAVFSFVGRIYWLGAACVIGAALCWVEAWRIRRRAASR
jgi:hypothetical protein